MSWLPRRITAASLPYLSLRWCLSCLFNCVTFQSACGFSLEVGCAGWSKWLQCELLCTYLCTRLKSAAVSRCFCFLSTDSYLPVSLPEDLLGNKIWEAQLFCCVSSSCVLIVREGKPSLIPGLGFSVLKSWGSWLWPLESHHRFHLPLRGGRKEMGLKLGTYPFPRGHKLHKTPSVRLW